MIKALLLSTVLVISGCAGIPSFYDDNESLLAMRVVFAVEMVDCNQVPMPSFKRVDLQTAQLKTYSTLKESDDVLRLVGIFEKSLNPVLERKAMTTKYCELKKETLHEQSSKMATTIMGRFQ